jgi:diacylglycerol kinase family enzyme
LLYNPSATTTTTAVIDVIAAALAKDTKLDVEATKRRNHAGFLAAGAAHEGYETVFVLGGDGTVNEVVQGLAGTEVRLGIIPGGSTNVWARTLGLTNDPVEATSILLRKLAAQEDRRVSLGVANGRYFGFNAGFGLDAEAVRLVEQRRRLKRTVRQASFLYCGLLAYARSFDRKTAITVTADGETSGEALRTVVICNSNPYTFLGARSAQLCPGAEAERGLDALGTTSMALPRMLRLVRVALTSADAPALAFTRLWHDCASLLLVADRPTGLQLDGDFVGATSEVRFELAERALTLIA